LLNCSIIVNEKSQIIIFKRDSPIRMLKSDKKISFSEIEKIEISYYTYINDDSGDNIDYWHINLITTRGERRSIFNTKFAGEAKKIAKGIFKITEKEVSFKNCSDFPYPFQFSNF